MTPKTSSDRDERDRLGVSIPARLSGGRLAVSISWVPWAAVAGLVLMVVFQYKDWTNNVTNLQVASRNQAEEIADLRKHMDESLSTGQAHADSINNTAISNYNAQQIIIARLQSDLLNLTGRTDDNHRAFDSVNADIRKLWDKTGDLESRIRAAEELNPNRGGRDGHAR